MSNCLLLFHLIILKLFAFCNLLLGCAPTSKGKHVCIQIKKTPTTNKRRERCFLMFPELNQKLNKEKVITDCNACKLIPSNPAYLGTGVRVSNGKIHA